MAGYLDNYGVVDAEREKKIKWLVIFVLSASILATILYFSFRDFSEKRKVSQFLDALRRQDLKSAYGFWGCTEQSPCRDYSYEKFLEDWGPKGVNAKFTNGSIADSERCGTGYIAAINSGSDELALWVERQNGVVSYAPWSNCPEKKLRLMKWLRMKFGHS